MVLKAVIKSVVELQNRQIRDAGQGVLRKAAANLPYVTDHPLLIGGMRGSGRTSLLAQVLRNEYADAWYTDFADPRLAGFDAGDINKLDELIVESGKGVLLFDNIDLVDGWEEYLKDKSARGCVVIAAVSLSVLYDVDVEAESGRNNGFVTYRLSSFSYAEFLEYNHKIGNEAMVVEFLQRGSFPEYVKTRRAETMLQLYNDIMTHDVILKNRLRDIAAVSQLALNLIACSGTFVSANGLREKLGVKAVSSVADNMNYLERAGLVSFLPVYSDQPSVRAVNPRKVMAADTALASVLYPGFGDDPNLLLEIAVYRHLLGEERQVYYMSQEGGCDFVVTEDGRPVKLVQVCYSGEYEPMQEKTNGLLNAMRFTGLQVGTIVTLDISERIEYEAGIVEVIDADSFLGEDKSFL